MEEERGEGIVTLVHSPETLTRLGEQFSHRVGKEIWRYAIKLIVKYDLTGPSMVPY